MRGKFKMEGIAADLVTGEVTHRDSHMGSEKAASIFRDPKIR
jgi:predicted RNA-binding protein with EMAP domain